LVSKLPYFPTEHWESFIVILTLDAAVLRCCSIDYSPQQVDDAVASGKLASKEEKLQENLIF
jgi:hypothetical protein